MTRVLITGSRNASAAMLDRARQIVAQIAANGERVIVGDADGIDAAVIAECDRLGVPVEVFGAYGQVRHHSTRGHEWAIKDSFLARDRTMAQHCDRCEAVWDGQSRGTRYTFEHARKYGKPVNVYNDSEA